MTDASLKAKALNFVLKKVQLYGDGTHQVAEHLKVTDDEAYDILMELGEARLIKIGGQTGRENKAKIVWYV